MIIVFSLEEKMNKINKTLEGCLAHTKKNVSNYFLVIIIIISW